MKDCSKLAKPLFLVTLISVLPIGPCGIACMQDLDQRLLDKFRTEAPMAWQKGQVEFGRFFSDNNGWQVETQRKTFWSDGQKTTSLSRHRIGTSYGLSRGSKPTGARTQTTEQSVWLYNPQYVAELKRSDENQRWVLSKLTRVPAASESPSLAITEILEIQYPLAASLANVERSTIHPFGKCPFGNQRYGRNWFELDELQFESIEELNESGRTLVRVNLKYQDMVYTGSDMEYRPHFCTAVFDSTNNWCLVHAVGEVQYDVNDKYRTTIDYEYEVTSGIQYMKSEKRRTVSLPDEKSLTGEDSQTEVTMAKLSPSDFTLSSFGLNEPNWYIPSHPWWLYASLTGMGMLLAGAILLRYGKKLWRRS